MKTLFMDTAWKNLVLVLMEDGQIVESLSMEAFKRQSEELFVELGKLLDQAGWKLADVDEVMITDGPGSYTGLRIAMTVAKILGTQSKAKVRTISTLQLYAGKAPVANVLLDARGHRAYAGHLENGNLIWSGILDLDQVPEFLEQNQGELYGEGELVSQPANPSDFAINARDLLDLAAPVDNVDALCPVYMKESDSYRV